jgi:uncharacterized 2Fe-2S/4Fe-4S cluster protein (DUF4445 family)
MATAYPPESLGFCPACGKQVGNVSGEVAKELLKQRRKESNKVVSDLIDMVQAGKTDDEIDEFMEESLTGSEMVMKLRHLPQHTIAYRCQGRFSEFVARSI